MYISLSYKDERETNYVDLAKSISDIIPWVTIVFSIYRMGLYDE